MLPKISSLFRLTRDPEVSFTAANLQITKLGLAASEKYKDKESTLFIDATAFGKTAEFIASVSKGQRVFICGKIQTESWEDKNGGGKRSKTTMIIESFEYVEKRGDAPQQNNPAIHASGNANQPNPTYQQAPAQQQGGATPNNFSDFDSEIHF